MKTSDSSCELTVYDGLKMAVSPAEAQRRVQELQAFIKSNMQPGINGDYAIIPGTQKPTLLQPGAQKLAEIYGFAIAYDDIETVSDWDRPLFVFRKRCVLTSRRDGSFICNGIGSANSKEDRYAWRWVSERDLPSGLDKSTLRTKTKQTQRGEWVQYRVPNEDVFSQVNTIEKIACKRALIHAVLNATRSSGLFSQDIEDLPPEAYGDASDARSWERKEDADVIVSELHKRISVAESVGVLNRIAADIKRRKIGGEAGDTLLGSWKSKKTELIGGEKKKDEKKEKKSDDDSPTKLSREDEQSAKDMIRMIAGASTVYDLEDMAPTLRDCSDAVRDSVQPIYDSRMDELSKITRKKGA